MADPLKVYNEIVHQAVEECGPDSKLAIEKAVTRRLKALPANVRKEVEDAVRRLTSFDGPGFHENGPH